MKLIAHRRNSLELLEATPRHLGVEMDVRIHQGRVVVAHDPHEDGPAAADWLDRYEHGTLIVNVKAEGVETLLLGMLAARGLEDFFLLDLSMPRLIQTVLAGESRVAVRVSEYERIQTALALQGLARWVWVDGFHGLSISAGALRELQDAGYRACLVSPELQGHDDEELAHQQAQIRASGMRFDAVCTKRWGLWQQEVDEGL